MRIMDWSSDVCSSDLNVACAPDGLQAGHDGTAPKGGLRGGGGDPAAGDATFGRSLFGRLGRLDLGGPGFDQFDQMIDDAVVLPAVVRQDLDVDLVGAAPAAGEADVGPTRLAGPVHLTPDPRACTRQSDLGTRQEITRRE